MDIYPLAALGSEDQFNAVHAGVFADGRPSVHGVAPLSDCPCATLLPGASGRWGRRRRCLAVLGERDLAIGRVVPFVKLKRGTRSVSRSSLNACDSAVAPLDDLAQLAELDLNGQRRDR